MKTTVFINYSEEHLGGGEICAGQENDSWPSHEDVVQRFDAENITLKNVTPHHEELVVDLPDPLPIGLFVVVVHYYDGGTFGRTCGYGSIEGAYLTKEEADLRAHELEFNGAKSVHGYNRWEGYFAGMERVEVCLTPILK